MLIGSKYKVEADRLNIILYEKYQKESEEDSEDEGEVETGWRVLGFYSTVENALRGMIDHNIRDTGLQDMKTINNRIGELYLLIMSLNFPTKESLIPAKGVEVIEVGESIKA